MLRPRANHICVALQDGTVLVAGGIDASNHKLSDAERARRLDVLRELADAPPTRSNEAVDEELRDIRRDRNTGWGRPTD